MKKLLLVFIAVTLFNCGNSIERTQENKQYFKVRNDKLTYIGELVNGEVYT